jgi:hypothetical protein
MCDVGARCPACQTDLDQYEVFCGSINGVHTRRYECACGAKTTVTIPAPGLTVTRQDAEYKP